MKSCFAMTVYDPTSRSREGAWIEILVSFANLMQFSVAPARERGLKCGMVAREKLKNYRRSREGAWIEMV